MISVDRMIAILDVLTENLGDKSMAPMMKRTLLKVIDRGNARELREAGREIEAMTRDMPQDWIDEVERRSDSHAGPSLDERAARILAAGRVGDDNEFRDLAEFVDSIYADSDRVDTLRRANELLAAYESRGRRKPSVPPS